MESNTGITSISVLETDNRFLIVMKSPPEKCTRALILYRYYTLFFHNFQVGDERPTPSGISRSRLRRKYELTSLSHKPFHYLRKDASQFAYLDILVLIQKIAVKNALLR